MNAEQAAALRAPFPPEQIGKLPKGGAQLSYVGHAAVNDRLLQVDPTWVWEPDRTADNRWDVQRVGKELVLTGRLTVCGVSRPCVGSCPENAFEAMKQLQSDAIRNGAMRFGVALDLWAKEDLSGDGHGSAPVAPSAGRKPNPTADAKKAILEAAGGDKQIAADVWGDRSDVPGPDELALMVEEAKTIVEMQASF